jgi:hypothetical protein
MANKEFVCKNCGLILDDEDYFCPKCKTPIKSSKFEISSIYEDQSSVDNQQEESLFSSTHANILNNEIITIGMYDEVLDEIYELGRKNIKIKESDSTLSKILKVAKAYAIVQEKNRGAELGRYIFNSIFVDDRLDESKQIATIIHELAHHLLFEIFEKILEKLWNVKKNHILETFIFYSLSNKEARLMNEYCAHTVEGRFIPHGYQAYGSFNNILQDNADIEKERLLMLMSMGNTFANDIIHILEKFIDNDLRNEIKFQYKKDIDSPKYSGIVLEIDSIIPDLERNNIIKNILNDGYLNALNSNFETVFDDLNKEYGKLNN